MGFQQSTVLISNFHFMPEGHPVKNHWIIQSPIIAFIFRYATCILIPQWSRIYLKRIWEPILHAINCNIYSFKPSSLKSNLLCTQCFKGQSYPILYCKIQKFCKKKIVMPSGSLIKLWHQASTYYTNIFCVPSYFKSLHNLEKWE